METKIISAEKPRSIPHAVKLLRAGRLVAFPTDTVYGMGAILTNPEAIEQLYVVKGRDSTKAIAVLVGSLEAIWQVSTEIGPTALRLAQRFWPGPLTLVVPRRSDLPANLSTLLTVGVRMPDHPITLRLLTLAGPLATTSANHSGMPDNRVAEEVYSQFNGLIPLILDGGRTPGGKASTVVDCTTAEVTILRQGPITVEQISAAITEK